MSADRPPRPYMVREVTWFNLAAKLLGYGSVFAAADTFVAPRLYGSLTYAAITVGVLTLIGLMADLVVVPVLGNVPALLLGYPVMVAIIWFVASWGADNHVSWLDAVVMALFLGPWEFLLHRMVLRVTGHHVPR
ncbi:MAG: hypothetical protein K6T78_03080 [Alicyclobacillus sp.]|nr:hypothetical protein [Alicyclobacillus sp.]